ncbi:MAG: hypothetical protein FWD49_04165 [Firmicutes bacterium]|nr:hypothetical protein [Bacillota bacterium]
MAKKSKAYFGLPWIVSVICAIFPLTAWLFGWITCLMRGKLLGAVLRFFGMLFGILWICDIITMILRKNITVLA